MCAHPLVITYFDSFERKMVKNLPRVPRFSSGIELRLVTAVADSILRLDTSCICLESRRLDTSYG